MKEHNREDLTKKKEETIFESGDEVRVCNRDNLPDKDKKDIFIECGKILRKYGPK